MLHESFPWHQTYYNDICKWDMTVTVINPTTWKTVVADHSNWRKAVTPGTQRGKEKKDQQKKERRQRKHQRSALTPSQPNAEFICHNCNKVCRSKIGLLNHSRLCSSTTIFLFGANPWYFDTEGCQQQQLPCIMKLLSRMHAGTKNNCENA